MRLRKPPRFTAEINIAKGTRCMTTRSTEVDRRRYVDQDIDRELGGKHNI
ncbi:MAG: hypothetical protein HY889_08520 [Deltaproteobacteria bacterium]|nr:hypothetical protein [Deltaproteobacteria bacterium]